MNIKLLNVKYGIGSCSTGDIPDWVTENGPAEEVAFFYFHQRDFIILNEDNPNFELYKTVIENYIKFQDSSRKEFALYCRKNFPKITEGLKVLDCISRIRRNLYRHMKERAAQ